MDRRRRRVVRRGALVAFAVLALAGSAVAAPPGKPPKPAGVPSAPPPAWIEAGTKEKWLAYSSYCWKIACVDYVSPEMRKDLPVLTIRRGEAGDAPSRIRSVAAEREPGKEDAKPRSAQDGDLAPGRRRRVDLRRPEGGRRRELRRPHQGSVLSRRPRPQKWLPSGGQLLRLLEPRAWRADTPAPPLERGMARSQRTTLNVSREPLALDVVRAGRVTGSASGPARRLLLRCIATDRADSLGERRLAPSTSSQ